MSTEPTPIKTKKEITKTEKKALLICLVLLLLIICWMLRSLASGIAIAALFAALTYPIYTKIASWVKVKWFASLITLFLMFLLILLPATLVGFLSYKELSQFVNRAPEYIPTLSQEIDKIYTSVQPLLYKYIPGYEGMTSLREYAQNGLAYTPQIGKLLLSRSAALSSWFFSTLFTLGISIFCLFYFYLDGPQIIKRLLHLFPMREEDEISLLQTFMNVTKAALVGSLLVSCIQGGLGALLLGFLGFGSPFVWGAVLTLLALIPGVGASLLLIPLSLYLLINSNWSDGLILLIGTIVVSLVDNLLRPVLIGRKIQMHDLMVFIFTLGGLASFGLAGFILGPALGALGLTLLNLYEKNFLFAQSGTPSLPVEQQTHLKNTSPKKQTELESSIEVSPNDNEPDPSYSQRKQDSSKDTRDQDQPSVPQSPKASYTAPRPRPRALD